jgi:hypothetical protein
MQELKKNQSHKKTREKKFEVAVVNFINLLSRIWNHDNSIKKKHKNNEAKDSIAKYQIMNLKKKSIFN